jgi:hypothetical protein
MRKSQKQQYFILIDGYTLIVEKTGHAIAFFGRHSRQSCSVYNDSWLIEFLANQTLDSQVYENFWRCLNQIEPYHAVDQEPYRPLSQELLPITIADADDYKDWSLWELVEYRTKADGGYFHEPIWHWVPGSYFPDHYMAHSAVIKIVQVARSWVESQQIPEMVGVEVLSRKQWVDRFDALGSNPYSARKFSASQDDPTSLLIPPILRHLEETAGLYLELFADNARFYDPIKASYLRQELLNRLGIAKLIDRDITTEILAQLAEYPSLKHCVIMGDRLCQKMNCQSQDLRIQQVALSLDWMLFEVIYPHREERFPEICLQAFLAANLPSPSTFSHVYPATLCLNMDGQNYRLVTSEEFAPAAKFKLVAAILVRSPQNPADLFADANHPSYLELLAWASLPDCPPPMEMWGLAIDWTGREWQLAALGSDRSLPQATKLLGYLSCHLANLWCAGNQVAFNVALAALNPNAHSPELQELRSRCLLLRSGELKFNYAEWCEGL